MLPGVALQNLCTDIEDKPTKNNNTYNGKQWKTHYHQTKIPFPPIKEETQVKWQV